METGIPDLSVSGGSIEYIVRAEQPFDVYFFVDQAQYDYYHAFISGDEPEKTPAGHETFSKAAVPASDKEGVYEAATENEGAREPLDVAGPYYFVVDHSNYRMENRVDEHGDPLSVFVDLEVVRKKVGI